MYDARTAYYERMNNCQRAGLKKVRNHMFSSDFGGCEANYRDQEEQMRRSRTKPADKKANCICNLVIDNTKNTGK